MARPTLDDIFSEEDAFGLLDVKPKGSSATDSGARGTAAMKDMNTFYDNHGRVPDADASDHDEMRLGSIWKAVRKQPTQEMHDIDRFNLLKDTSQASQTSWRDVPLDESIPVSLEDIFDDDDLDVDLALISLKHTTAAAERFQPDHRAEFTPCRDFERYAERFEAVQQALEKGERNASPVKKWSVIEPLEGDFFIRNGLLALIAEKSEMTSRGGSRDHRLRVIFSNGTESDPLMSSFRKSLNDDKAARTVQKIGLGPLDPEWEADQLDHSGTIYVLRSLSQDPAFVEQKTILHKIGVTSQDVRRRVSDARNDPTFLMAPVEIVATFELKNLPRRKVEQLLHRFFEAAKPAELFVTDRFGKKIYPKEWFFVLPEQVGEAAKLIKNGTLHRHFYNVEKQVVELRRDNLS
jgi:hypothetical protein